MVEKLLVEMKKIYNNCNNKNKKIKKTKQKINKAAFIPFLDAVASKCG